MSSKTAWISPTSKQSWVSLACMMSKLGAGLLHGFGSAVILYVKSPESTIKMDLGMISTFVSLLMTAGFAGNLITAVVADKYGRRTAGLFCNMPAIIGGVILHFASDYPTLIIGRFLTGFTVGSHVVLATVVVAEYTSPQNRGMFFNMKTAAFNFGSILSHLIAHRVEWRYLALITTIPYILCLIIAFTSPESPSWLAQKQNDEKTKQAFYWLRGKTEDTTRELEELIKSQKSKKVENHTFFKKMKSFLLICKEQRFWKPTLILFFCFVLMESSGRHLIPSYGSQIAKDVISEDINLFYYRIVIDALSLSGCVLAAYLITIVKYRTLLLSSGIVSFLIMLIACTTLCLIDVSYISKSYGVVSMCLFGLYFFLSNMGCSCIPFALMGELYPLEYRAAGTALSGNLILLMISVSLKVYPFVQAACKTYGAFFILAAVMGPSLLILYFILPETKNKTLLEIEEYFDHGKFRDGELVPNDDIECSKDEK